MSGAHRPVWHNGGDPDLHPAAWYATCCAWRSSTASRLVVGQQLTEHLTSAS